MSSRPFTSVFQILALLTCFWACHATDALSESAKAVNLENQFSNIGSPGPRAIELDVTTSKSEGNVPGKEDLVSVGLSLSESGYVLALYIAPTGDVIVVFPDQKTTDNLLANGKSYQIVSPDTGLKLGFTPSADKGRIVIYASSRPFAMEDLTTQAPEGYVKISSGDTKALSRLYGIVEEAAKSDKFNRKIITPEDLSRAGEGFGFMGLPRGLESSQPESVAGVQGAKDQKKPSGKQ